MDWTWMSWNHGWLIISVLVSRHAPLFVMYGKAPAIPDSPPKGILPKLLSLDKILTLLAPPPNESLEPQFIKNRFHIHIQHSRVNTQNQEHPRTTTTTTNKGPSKLTTANRRMVWQGHTGWPKPFFKHGICATSQIDCNTVGPVPTASGYGSRALACLFHCARDTW